MGVRHVRAVLDHEIRPPGRKLLLLALAERANPEGETWPSRAQLCEDASLTPKMVGIHLAALTAEGWIRIHRGNRHTKKTIYYLNLEKLAISRDAEEPRQSLKPARQPRRATKERTRDGRYDDDPDREFYERLSR